MREVAGGVTCPCVHHDAGSHTASHLGVRKTGTLTRTTVVPLSTSGGVSATKPRAVEFRNAAATVGDDSVQSMPSPDVSYVPKRASLANAAAEGRRKVTIGSRQPDQRQAGAHMRLGDYYAGTTIAPQTSTRGGAHLPVLTYSAGRYDGPLGAVQFAKGDVMGCSRPPPAAAVRSYASRCPSVTLTESTMSLHAWPDCSRSDCAWSTRARVGRGPCVEKYTSGRQHKRSTPDIASPSPVRETRLAKGWLQSRPLHARWRARGSADPAGARQWRSTRQPPCRLQRQESFPALHIVRAGIQIVKLTWTWETLSSNSEMLRTHVTTASKQLTALLFAGALGQSQHEYEGRADNEDEDGNKGA